MPDLISDCCYEDYKDRKRDNQERVVEETLEAPEKAKQKMTMQQKMWNSFENPQVSSVALGEQTFWLALFNLYLVF
jgi:hypothetical protein